MKFKVGSALLVGVVACGGIPQRGAAEQRGVPATEARSLPPDFELDTLEGGSLRLGDHLGSKVILLDFWATWCEPCLAAMPDLASLYDRYRDEGFLVLGISIDGPESLAQVRSVTRKLRVNFPILLDRETRVAGLYNPKLSAPYSVLIARSGRILVKKEGYSTGDSRALEADVLRALR